MDLSPGNPLKYNVTCVCIFRPLDGVGARLGLRVLVLGCVMLKVVVAAMATSRNEELGLGGKFISLISKCLSVCRGSSGLTEWYSSQGPHFTNYNPPLAQT